MSVIPFSTEELAAIVAVATKNLTDGHSAQWKRETIQDLSRQLALISRANARAYNATYEDKMRALTAKQIGARATYLLQNGVYFRRMELVWVLRNARLLAYNCVSNGGRDYATPAIKAAIVSILGVMLTVAIDHISEGSNNE